MHMLLLWLTDKENIMQLAEASGSTGQTVRPHASKVAPH